MAAAGVGVAVLCAAATAGQGGASVATDSRVFEMRTYHAAEGRAQEMHARFRQHTSALFRKHGMTIVGYWVPLDEKTGATNEDLLVYILAYPDLEARRAAWRAFGSDPEWRRVKAESEKNGPIVAKVDSVFLKATDYSPLK
ncbi:MAG TPA: NIPSNAP family protein [Vicinamibacterales bacterium]